ncbi:hypothetical protein NWQ34_01410 [Mycoplasmopsis felis]|uniref:hypothetical protein n=1 Tax=Mycoplasmopsis felis TaxID=33923 RepID=UPI0021E0136F|nr:hypothetical protein [Mycoplasmopsis felis]MCU9938354.1 hypothetical protein [Mycoplasmopsis felis]
MNETVFGALELFVIVNVILLRFGLFSVVTWVVAEEDDWLSVFSDESPVSVAEVVVGADSVEPEIDWSEVTGWSWEELVDGDWLFDQSLYWTSDTTTSVDSGFN